MSLEYNIEFYCSFFCCYCCCCFNKSKINFYYKTQLYIFFGIHFFQLEEEKKKTKKMNEEYFFDLIIKSA
jgi:hypothetical protein